MLTVCSVIINKRAPGWKQKSLMCPLGCGKQVPELQVLLCCPAQPLSETSRMSSNPTAQLCLLGKRNLQAFENLKFGVGFGLSGSESGKKQELTKKHTTKQSCSGCERRRME